MSWTWLDVVLAIAKLANLLIAFLSDRQLIQAGEAKNIAEGFQLAHDRTQAALEARRRANDGDPDPNDPYARD